MLLSILEEALEMLKARGGHSDQKETDIANCFIELHEMKEAAKDPEYYQDVTVLPALLTTDLGNRLWYDVYGKMAKRVGHDHMIPGNFISAVHQDEYCTEISSLVLEDLFYLLHDLWLDNEQSGSNNPDGTFRHTKPAEIIEPDAILAKEMLDHLGKQFDATDCDDDETHEQFYNLKVSFTFGDKTVTFDNGAAVYNAMQQAMEFIIDQQ